MARKATSTQKSTPRKARATRKEPAVVKQQKPVFRLGTLVTVLVLAVMIAVAFYLNREKKITDAETTSTGEAVSFLFGAEDGNVSSIEITPADGETVRVARNAESVWALELPIETEANQGLAEAAASQISALEIVQEIDGDLETFGLDAPSYVMTIKFAGGKEHTIEIGDITITGSGYYARVDKDKMMVIDINGIDSLLNLVNFPPYLNTLTPTALPPTATPVPPTAEAPTLETTVTPTP